MTISLVGIGAQGVGTTSAYAAYVAGLEKDAIALFLAAKPHSIADPTHAAYDVLLSSGTSGSAASVLDGGSVRLVARLRDSPAPTAASGNTITVTGGDTAQARTVRVTTDLAGFLGVDGWAFADTTATGTTVSASGTVPAGAISVGDFLAVEVALGDDVPNHESQSLSVAGCTLGTITWTKAQTNQGNHLASYIGTCTVASGSSTGSVTYTATSNVDGKSACAVSLVRFRDTEPAPTSDATLTTDKTTLQPGEIATLTLGGGTTESFTQTAGTAATITGTGSTRQVESPLILNDETMTFSHKVTGDATPATVNITALGAAEQVMTATGIKPAMTLLVT